MPVQAIRPVQKWADDDSEEGFVTPRRTISVRTTAPTIETPIVHQNAFSYLTPEQAVQNAVRLVKELLLVFHVSLYTLSTIKLTFL